MRKWQSVTSVKPETALRRSEPQFRRNGMLGRVVLSATGANHEMRMCARHLQCRAGNDARFKVSG